MIIIFDSLYLISVYHRKKNILVQHAVSGSLDNAQSLMDAIISGPFKNKLKCLTGTIVELTGKEMNFYGCYEKLLAAERGDMDKDLYLYQAYSKESGENSVIFIYASFDSTSEAIKAMKSGGDCSRLPSVMNKVNYRGISRIGEDGSETKVEFIKTSYCPCCNKAEIEAALNKTSL